MTTLDSQIRACPKTWGAETNVRWIALAWASLLAVWLLLLSLGSTGAARAAETRGADCAALLSTGADNRIPERFLASRDIGRQLQDGLRTIFDGEARYQAARQSAPHPLSDGYIGDVTRRWLEQLCLDFPVHGAKAEVPELVPRAALHYAEIAAAHPDWKRVVTSPAFEEWLRGSSLAEAEARHLRLSGAAPVLVGLLNEYAAITASNDPRAACSSWASGGDNGLHQLAVGFETEARRVQDGLLAVYAKNAALGGGNLNADSLRSEQGFGDLTQAWLERFCADFPVSGTGDELAGNLLRAVLHYQEISAARPDWREVVTDAAFDDWVREPGPGGAPSTRALRRSGSAPIVIELIKDYPVDPCPSGQAQDRPEEAAIYYQLTEHDLKALAGRAALRDELVALAGKQFETGSELEQAVSPILQALQDQCVRNRFRKAFYDRGSSSKVYRLTKGSLDQLRDQWSAEAATEAEADLRLAQDLLSALVELESEDFQSEEQLTQVVRFTVRLAMAGSAQTDPDAQSVPGPEPATRTAQAVAEALVEQVVQAAATVTLYELPADAGIGLARELRFAAPPEAALKALQPLLGVPYVDARLYETAVEEALAVVAGEAPPYLQTIVTAARKQGRGEHPLELKPMRDCGCARQWDTVGRKRFTVYGFYPFWMSDRVPVDPESPTGDEVTDPADEEAADLPAGNAVNFGIMSRIGYFGLEIDEAGRIANPELWASREHSPESFVETAHKYLSQVDVVIEAPQWRSWGRGAIEQAVASMAGLLIPGSKPSPGAAIPDGITLYFPGFAGSTPDQQQVIVELVQRLQAKLRLDRVVPQGGVLGRQLLGDSETEGAVALNILIDAVDLDLDKDASAQGERRLLGHLTFLGGLSEVLVQDEAMVDLVLVLLGEPVTHVKKRLRLAIENEFQGEDRTNVLRRILPVIPPNGHKGEATVQTTCFGPGANDPYWQLQHDLVYFRDNFRGVAFWPFPAGSATDMQVLKSRLNCIFAQSSQSELMHLAGITALLPNLCLYVCPNRYPVMIFFLGGAGALLLAGILAYGSCSVRRWLAKLVLPLLALIGLLVVIFVAVITCIPTLQELEPEILGTLVMILLGSWLFYYIRKVKHGPLP